MNDLQEPQKIHYLQTPYGESLLCNQALQEKGPFQRLEIYKHAWLRSTMTQERFSNLTVLNSHKERTAKSLIPHTHTRTLQKRWSLVPSLLKMLRVQCYMLRLWFGAE